MRISHAKGVMMKGKVLKLFFTVLMLKGLSYFKYRSSAGNKKSK